MALAHGGENNGWVLICSLQNCIFLLGDSSEVTHRITSKFCDDKKDTLLYIMSNFQWFICTLLTDRNEHEAAKADSSLSNQRAPLSRSLATGLSVDSRYLSLLWRHNGCDSVSNHKPHECLLNRSFMRRPKKTPKLRVTGLCVGNSPETHKWPVTRKMFPFDDVIMSNRITITYTTKPGVCSSLCSMKAFDLAPNTYNL